MERGDINLVERGYLGRMRKYSAIGGDAPISPLILNAVISTVMKKNC